MQRLTFNGVNDLYQTPYGAHTLERYAELVELRKNLPKSDSVPQMIPISDELAARNERCIDQYGCGLF